MTNPENSDGYKLGYSASMFEGIVEHLEAALAQRSKRDAVTEQIDKALSLAKSGQRALTSGLDAKS